jgi:hypothetical protein
MFADRWRREKEREKQNKKPDDTGPSFYTVRRHRLGAGLLDTAHSSDRERPIRSIMNTDSGDHEHPLALA